MLGILKKKFEAALCRVRITPDVKAECEFCEENRLAIGNEDRYDRVIQAGRKVKEAMKTLCKKSLFQGNNRADMWTIVGDNSQGMRQDGAN